LKVSADLYLFQTVAVDRHDLRRGALYRTLGLQPNLLGIDKEVGFLFLIKGCVKAFFADETEGLKRSIQLKPYLFSIIRNDVVALYHYALGVD
jgi:hypothetical protein